MYSFFFNLFSYSVSFFPSSSLISFDFFCFSYSILNSLLQVLQTLLASLSRFSHCCCSVYSLSACLGDSSAIVELFGVFSNENSMHSLHVTYCCFRNNAITSVACASASDTASADFAVTFLSFGSHFSIIFRTLSRHFSCN